MNTLFETRTDADLRREAVADNERRIHAALMDKGPWPLKETQRKVLECLRMRQGRLQAMTMDEIGERTGQSRRVIRQNIRSLVVDFRLPIVASCDSDTGGYYFATSAEERFAGTSDLRKEAVGLLQRMGVILNESDMGALLGQLALEAKGAE
jgi:hypothetical protein